MLRKTLIILCILLIILAPFCFADNFISGWVKQKFKIGNPTHQCEVMPSDEEDCRIDGKPINKHMCQLYKGFDSKKGVMETCGFCITRSGLREDYIDECLITTIEVSHFAGEDLIGQITDDKLDEMDEDIAELGIMESKLFAYSGGQIGVLIDYDGTTLYTKDGKNYFDSLYTAIEYEPSEGVFSWFGAIFKRNVDTNDEIAFQIYEDYSESSKDVETAFKAYKEAMNAPFGADFSATAVVELLKQGKKETFAKAAKEYSADRIANSAENMRIMYNDGEIAWIEHLSITRDFESDVFLAMLEETYQKTKLATSLVNNKI